MTAQEILEGIIRHRSNPMTDTSAAEVSRKNNEIEWGLQALAQYLAEREAIK
jgi:hypothetical protein